jgi:hypothetical protein
VPEGEVIRRALALAVLVALAACHRPCAVRCVPDAADDVCAKCLKSKCCPETAAWYDGTDPLGYQVVACVKRTCAAECPRAPQAER